MDRTPKQLLKNYLMIFLGCAVYALAFDWCFEPNAIGFGGVTGLAQIVNVFFPQINIGLLVILFNIPLFLIGWRLFGTHMLISSLTAMALSSLILDALAITVHFPPMEDVLLACVVGGVLLGLSLGIIFLQGATTGGTEIVARLLKQVPAGCRPCGGSSGGPGLPQHQYRSLRHGRYLPLHRGHG